jgi:hypothetical protein
MSPEAIGPIRTLAFGDLDADIWGCAWVPDLAAAGVAHAGAIDNRQAQSGAAATLTGTDPDEPWELVAGATRLTATPIGDPAPAPEPVAGTVLACGGFAQLCHVTGSVPIDGEAHSVECLGYREAIVIADEKAESVRSVSAWFDGGEGFAVSAARSRRAKGHERDDIRATLFEAGAALAVADPRLSSTYGADGNPVRAGLELWLTAAEDEDEEHPQYPRRAAGAAVGATATASALGLRIRTDLFRWRLHGAEGLGIYRLAARA